MYTIENRVRYSEVDSGKQLTLPSLLDYLQDCCTFQSEDLGVGIDFLNQSHCAWILSSWQIKISRYPTLGEQIKVNTWPYDFKGFYGHRNFTMENSKGEQLVRANSIWVFMDMERMRPVRIPETLQDTYKNEIANPLPGEWSARRIVIPEDGEKQTPVQVARFFIDTNHHMNNSKYVLAAEEYLPEHFPVGELRVEYKKAAVLGDLLYPAVIADESQVMVNLTDESGKTYAAVHFMREESNIGKE